MPLRFPAHPSEMTTCFAIFLALLPLILIGYASVGYPALLLLAARYTRPRSLAGDPEARPSITIMVPAYNEEASIRSTLERLLELNYPHDKRQIIVVSDASTDGTDEIVREFEGRGVELVRLPTRSGKSAAENAAAQHARGEILVNIDATIRVEVDALLPLIDAFRDPTVGVASGRDVSVGKVDAEGNQAEAGYVGYEMWVRRLESQVHSIVGASGCFFATRARLFDGEFPAALSRDFASALIAREHGYRSVSVDDAICYVPRTRSLRSEFSRKVRTMARGLATLEFKKHLLNPGKFGLFSVMLWSHKLSRWLFYPSLPLSLAGLLLLAPRYPGLYSLLLLGGLGILAGMTSLLFPENRKLPAPLAMAGFAVVSNAAGIVAWWKYLDGERQAVWEPTRRG